LHFFSESPFSPSQGVVVAPPEKPNAGKTLLFIDFRKHLADPKA
jgi:hypothetical protein